MILWLNGAFGAGKTSVAGELQRRLPDSFLFDPENAGFYIRENSPSLFSRGDFQDIPLWRTINAEMLCMIAAEYPGTILVPMTVTDSGYYREMTGRARAQGTAVRHFVLYARRETVLHRLEMRSGSLQKERFALDALDRCMNAFDGDMRDIRIETDNCGIRDAAEQILTRCLPDLAGERILP